MIQLNKFLNNPFADEKISLEKKKKFSEDHLSRLAVQNSLTGNFALMLSATATAHEAFYGELTDKSVSEAIKKSLTQSTNLIINDFKKRTSQLSAFLIGKGYKGTTIYTKFFPVGVSGYTSDLTKGNVEQRIDHLILVLEEHHDDAGGEAVLQEFKDFKEI